MTIAIIICFVGALVSALTGLIAAFVYWNIK